MCKDPGNPTWEEIERHNCTHMPYRSWCPVCVESKGKEDPHYSKKVKGARDKDTVGLDYKSLGQEANEEDKRTCIIGRDKKTGITFAHVVN